MVDNYSAWEINESDFPVDGSLQEQIKFLIGYGILAPSTHNTQPWQFDVGQKELKISANPLVDLPNADPQKRNLQISLGCCVTNIVVAAEHFGLEVLVRWGQERISLTFQKQTTNKISPKLFDVITKRFSDKLAYQDVQLNTFDKEKLLRLLPPKGCNLVLLTDRDKIRITAEAQRAATLNYASNRQFFKELSQWLRPSNSKQENGMPGFVIGLSNIQSKMMRFMIRNVKGSVKLAAKQDYIKIMSSSATGFITTQSDNPEEWFKAGRFYELLALEATANNVVMTPLAAVIEDKQQRAKIVGELSLGNKPQIFFRLGYSNHKPYHTPRRNYSAPFMKTQQQLAKLIDSKLESKQLQVGPYNINYVVLGAGKPILLIHGANIGWAQWYQNIAELAKKYKVYALDLPGAGNSTNVNFHKTNLEKDYVQVVDKFITKLNFKKIDIVASSFGGWIALRLAIEQKPYINKIVLTNPIAFTTHMPLQFRPVSIHQFALFLSKTVLRPKRNNKNLEKFMRDVFHDKQLPLASEFVEYFYELSVKSHNILFISRLSHPSGMRKELFLKDGLSKIRNSVMVIWGMKDPLMPYSTVESTIPLIPKVTLKKLDNVGHMPPVESPSEFNSLTISFLEN